MLLNSVMVIPNYIGQYRNRELSRDVDIPGNTDQSVQTALFWEGGLKEYFKR